jgi:hypothetical protein
VLSRLRQISPRFAELKKIVLNDRKYRRKVLGVRCEV